MEAVKKLDYHQNKLAIGLKTGRTNSLGLIIPEITNMYYPNFEKHLEEYASQNGYMVYLCNTNYDLETEKKFVENLCLKKVDGIIIVPCSNEYKHIMKLKDLGVPYVCVNRNFNNDIEHCVQTNNFKAAYECITYLIDQGHRKISGIFQSFNNMIYEERYIGMVAAMKDRGIPLNQENILFNVDDLDNSDQIIEKMLRKKNRPEAVFTSNDMLAFSVYKAAYNCGLKIPDDLSVVGYDSIMIADKIIPPLTSYYTPVKELAHACVMHICASINGEPLKKFPLFEGKLEVRDSVKKKIL